MNDVLKSLGATLRRVYGAMVQKPMTWRMIDRLATLEETESKPRDARDARSSAINGHPSETSKPGVSKPEL